MPTIPDSVVAQVILQFPTVGILIWLLFRLDARMADLIRVIVDLAQSGADSELSERLDRYLDNSKTKF